MAQLIIGDRGAASTYRRILETLISDGERVAPRGLPTRAISNVVIVHEDPGDVLLTGLGRGLSPGLLALEPLQLVGGFSDPEITIKTVARYAQFLDPVPPTRPGVIEVEFHGAYGVRIGEHMRFVADRLKKDPATRQAQINFWNNEKDLPAEGKHDYPCTVTAHFELDTVGRLNGTTVMRSNDAWLGYPYDVVQHTSLLKSLARFLHVPVGTYTHIVHNLHLYERDIVKAEALLDTMHLGDKRPRMDGGIGNGDEATWTQVAQRARTLFYNPCALEPATEEEAWYQRAMLTVHES
jgi:thymidylate synthase